MSDLNEVTSTETEEDVTVKRKKSDSAHTKVHAKKVRTTDSITVLSVQPQGRGYRVTYKNGGEYKTASLSNFYTEYPQYIYSNRVMKMLKKKYDSATEEKPEKILESIIAVNK